MKLSEAMRKGIAMSAPLVNRLAELRDEHVYACALGAAGLGAGLSSFATLSESNQDLALCEAFKLDLCPVLDRPMIELLNGDYVPEVGEDLYAIIGTLNDDGLMTREEIADWLESIGR